MRLRHADVLVPCSGARAAAPSVATPNIPIPGATVTTSTVTGGQGTAAVAGRPGSASAPVGSTQLERTRSIGSSGPAGQTLTSATNNPFQVLPTPYCLPDTRTTTYSSHHSISATEEGNADTLHCDLFFRSTCFYVYATCGLLLNLYAAQPNTRQRAPKSTCMSCCRE